jgi:hypothetical protein
MRQKEMPCADCTVETAIRHGIGVGLGSYYMARDHVWQRAYRAGRPARFLCLNCLGRRLGRPLRVKDFAVTPAELYNRLASTNPHPLLPWPNPHRQNAYRQNLLDYWRTGRRTWCLGELKVGHRRGQRR